MTEMMVAAISSGIIVAAGFGALTVSQKVTRANSQAMNTQSTARNALDMITADLKLAGYGMQGTPGPVGNCAINGAPAAIVPADNNPLGADTGPDREGTRPDRWDSLGTILCLIGAAVILFFNFARGLFLPISNHYINEVTPSHIRATVLSIKNIPQRLVFALVSPFLGWMADIYSLPIALIISAGFFLVSSAIALLALRRNKVI